VTERSDGTSVGLVERGGRLVLPLTERSVSGAFGQKCPTVKGRPPSAKCYDLLGGDAGAEREGVNFLFRAKGQQKNFSSRRAK
jgi:hypothetical protein